MGRRQHFQWFCPLYFESDLIYLSAKKKDLKATLSEDEVDVIKKTFKERDVDGNGTITSEELQKFMKEQGEKLPEAVIDVMIAMADTDGDGKINFEEFLQMAITG